MTAIEKNNSFWKILLTAALMIVMLGLAMVMGAEAQDARLDRKVRVMERVLDEILVQSEHVMVSHGEVARGLILNEFGALFMIEGSLGANEFLVDAGVWTIAEGQFLEQYEATRRSSERGERADWKQMQKKAKEKREKNLSALKRELSEALVDYGATLTELKDDQWVAIALFLGDRVIMGSERGERLVLKIKMRDLRQHASGAISSEAAMKKVIIDAS